MSKLTPLLFFVLISTQTVRASSHSDSHVFRKSFALGAWQSMFEQKSPTHSAKVSSLLSPGVNAQLGFNLSVFFVEYNFTWLFSHYSENPKARDASYIAPYGIHIGIAPKFIPIELYVGTEKGNYRLSGGASPLYEGIIYKAGLNILFTSAMGQRLGLKFEYRDMDITRDDAGPFINGITTRTKIYSISFVMGS